MNGNDRDLDEGWGAVVTGFKWMFFVCCLVIALVIWAKSAHEGKRLADERKSLEAWQAAGCPVYKSSCGSEKHPYGCERKAAAVGRNAAGDIFVEAYPLCEVKP
jgi:hypothetical protein